MYVYHFFFRDVMINGKTRHTHFQKGILAMYSYHSTARYSKVKVNLYDITLRVLFIAWYQYVFVFVYVTVTARHMGKGTLHDAREYAT